MNYGLNWSLEKQQQSDKDWIFGATSTKCLATIPPSLRWAYLPVGEVQRGAEDMMDCASRAPLNILETKFNFLIANKLISPDNIKWLKDKGYIGLQDSIEFSDAFVAINSGTTRQGNSLKAPLEAIRTQGLIPKSMLPLEKWMTWEDYHNPERITPAMVKLGMDFASRFRINYEKVYETNFENILKTDLLDCAGYAWPEPVEGEYPRTTLDPNHAFMVFNNPRYNIFDNYLDTVDGDFIKKLTTDYDLMDYGYRVFISKEVPSPPKRNWLWELLKRIFT